MREAGGPSDTYACVRQEARLCTMLCTYACVRQEVCLYTLGAHGSSERTRASRRASYGPTEPLACEGESPEDGHDEDVVRECTQTSQE